MTDSERDIERISAEIQQYLHHHPNAADTIEGITKWWLARQRYEEATIVVRRALEHLISLGLVAQSTNADDQRIYRKGGASDQSSWDQ